MIESSIYKSRPGNFFFMCDGCQANHEMSEAATQTHENNCDEANKNKTDANISQSCIMESITKELSQFKSDILADVKDVVSDLVKSARVTNEDHTSSDSNLLTTVSQ